MIYKKGDKTSFQKIDLLNQLFKLNLRITTNRLETKCFFDLHKAFDIGELLAISEAGKCPVI